MTLGDQNWENLIRGARHRDQPCARKCSGLELPVLAFVLIGVAGCSGSIRGLPIDTGTAPIAPGDPAHETTVQIKYLGAGGVLIK